MLSVTAESFEDLVINSPRLVVVDFWAEWCGPCKVFAPTLEKVSKDYDMTFVKVNIDNEPEIAETYGIRSIPTLLIFHKEEPVAQSSGVVPEDRLRNELDYALALTDDFDGIDSRMP